MGWFWKKKEVKVPYVPQGRIGFRRVEIGTSFHFTVIFEEIGRIGNKSKLRVLEVDVDRDINKTPKECMNRWGIGEWLSTTAVNWETDEQKAIRLGQVTPQVYHINEEELQEEVTYRLTPHNFINNEQEQ